MGKPSMRNCFVGIFRVLQRDLTVFLVVILLTLCAGTVRSDTGVDRSAGMVSKIEFRKSADDSEAVFVHLDRFQTPKMFSLDGENPRVVCDFKDLQIIPGLASKHEFPGRFIRAVRLALHHAPSPRLRIVFDLVPGIPIDVSPYFFQEESIFALTLSGSPTDAP